jgi:YggT family protein
VILRLIVDLVQLYILVLFVRIIMSWFPLNPWSRGARMVNVLVKVTDPVLVPVRKLLPPMHLGGMAIDLSPIIVFVVLEILLSILRAH